MHLGNSIPSGYLVVIVQSFGSFKSESFAEANVDFRTALRDEMYLMR